MTAFRIRITHTATDGLVFAVCAPGSWKPLMVFTSRGEALEALR